MSDEGVEFRVEGLDKIIKALKITPPVARIGILGDKNARSGKANSNATIGACHEFGTSKLPMRSFLRVPLADHLYARLIMSDAVEKSVIKDVIKTGSVVAWLKKIAIVAEGIVAEAFDTGGFGKWKPSNMSHKKNQQTLVETQQLRNSITSEVLG